MPKETYAFEKSPIKEAYEGGTLFWVRPNINTSQKRPVHLKRDQQKRPTKETYNKTNKRDLQKRPRLVTRYQLKKPTKETNKGNQRERPIKKTYKRDL